MQNESVGERSDELYTRDGLEQAGTVWRFPIQTVQNSEGGLERSYQCSAILPHWKITLSPGESWGVEITSGSRRTRMRVMLYDRANSFTST